jgi:uncharacterized protein YceK
LAKTGGLMKKIPLYFLIILIGIISSGCATTTRTVAGIGGTAYGFGTGAVKDTKDTANAIMRADKWFRENCW